MILIAPKLFQAYFERGVIYHILQQYEEAVSDFTKVIQLNPKDAQVYANRGNTYLALKQSEKALLDHLQAVKLNPDNIDFNFNVGAVYNNLGKLQEALPYFEKAAQLGDLEAAEAVNNIKQKLMTNTKYTQETNQTPPTQLKDKRGIGRNDPCPCGSGLKYKKCCLNKRN